MTAILLILILVIICPTSFLLGFFLKGITKKVAEIEQAITMKADKKPVVEEPSSTFIDPTDVVQEAIWQHAQQMRELNPDE